MAHGPRLRANGLHGLLDDWRELDVLSAQFDLASCDTVHVEQIVHETRHLAHLAPQHLGCRLKCRAVAAAKSERCRGVADRRQRVPQLVRKHGQELGLAPIGLGQIRGKPSQVVCQPLSVSHILADGRERDRSAGGVRQRQNLVRHPECLPGLEVSEANLDLAVALLQH